MEKLNYLTVQMPDGNQVQIPDLEIPLMNIMEVGKYGHMREKFLKEHQPNTRNQLLILGELKAHLQSVEAEAQREIQTIITQMAAKDKVTEEMKAQNQIEWVQMMNNLQNAAEEMVLAELIYS